MINARRRSLPLQRLFVFQELSGVTMYVVPTFFRYQPLRFMQREDFNLSRTAAKLLARDLAQEFYDEELDPASIACKLPKRIQQSGVMRSKEIELGMVHIQVSNESKPIYRSFLAPLENHRHVHQLTCVA